MEMSEMENVTTSMQVRPGSAIQWPTVEDVL